MPMNGEISLYIHIPFCHRKCPYCHFYVVRNHANHHKILMEALWIEWERICPKIENSAIVSIYFGGGTPTLLGTEPIHALLTKIKSDAWVAEDCEITIEANPEDAYRELMQGFRAAGINRVSLGVQSLEDDSLLQIGRGHNSIRAIDAIYATYQAGIENISIDLMFELPQQTVSSFENTLKKIKPLPIQHLSLYNLTIEPGTAFFKRKLSLPSPEENLQMLEAATLYLETMDLQRYEISAFAKSGFRSRHNTGYWTGRPFFGLGPSAFSYFEGKRFRNVANLHRYNQSLRENQSPVDFVEKLPYPENVHELLAVRLRLLEGVDIDCFSLPEKTKQKLQQLTSEGYLINKGNHYRISPRGMLFYDTVAAEIV